MCSQLFSCVQLLAIPWAIAHQAGSSLLPTTASPHSALVLPTPCGICKESTSAAPTQTTPHLDTEKPPCSHTQPHCLVEHWSLFHK